MQRNWKATVEDVRRGLDSIEEAVANIRSGLTEAANNWPEGVKDETTLKELTEIMHFGCWFSNKSNPTVSGRVLTLASKSGR